RNPEREDLPPRPLLHLIFEKCRPVGHASIIAQRRMPRGGFDSRIWTGPGAQRLSIAIGPFDNAVAPAHRAQRLRRHRSVIAEAAAVFRTVRTENIERVVEGGIVGGDHERVPPLVWRRARNSSIEVEVRISSRW